MFQVELDDGRVLTMPSLEVLWEDADAAWVRTEAGMVRIGKHSQAVSWIPDRVEGGEVFSIPVRHNSL